jgi:hypothetical protein
MRFFTIDWWLGPPNDDPFDDYATHLEALRPFPTEIAAFDQLPSLHDARLRRLEHADRIVEIDLGAERKPLTLRYSQVDSLVLMADPAKGLPGPHGLGDLGYDEIVMPFHSSVVAGVARNGQNDPLFDTIAGGAI